MSERERFLASCRQQSDYLVVKGDRVTVHIAVERPLDEHSGQRLADWAQRMGVSGVIGSNFIHLRLNEGVSAQQLLEQLEACRKWPLSEGMAEILDRTGLWDDLSAQAEVFIREKGEVCDVFSHLREPILNVPRTQFRWSE